MIGYDITPFNNQDSFAFQLDCDDDVTVSYAGAREVLVLRPHNSDTGTGAWAQPLFANMLFEGSVSASFDSSNVSLLAGSGGIHAGEFSASGPGMEESWQLDPSPEGDGDLEGLIEDPLRWDPYPEHLYRATGGPGDYRMELTYTGGLYHWFWAALFGPHPLEHPENLMTLLGFDD